MPISDIKAHQKELELKVMTETKIPMNVRVKTIKKIEEIVKVLSHPARRLSYDTFGMADT